MVIARRDVLAGGAAMLVWSGAAHAAEPAADLLAGECALAGQEGKRVLVVFFASWCSWCRLMDAALADPQAADIWDAHFRVVHLRAGEHDDDQRVLQLPGADDVYARYAGPDGAGLPFIAVLDAEANAVATSITQISGGNFGFPVTDDELDGLEAMLATAAPAMSAGDRRALREACVRVMRGRERT